MADKNIFVDKPFLSLNISDLSPTTPQKVHPSFPVTPSRNWDHVEPPPSPVFSNFGRRCNPSQQKGGRGLQYIYLIIETKFGGDPSPFLYFRQRYVPSLNSTGFVYLIDSMTTSKITSAMSINDILGVLVINLNWFKLFLYFFPFQIALV